MLKIKKPGLVVLLKLGSRSKSEAQASHKDCKISIQEKKNLLVLAKSKRDPTRPVSNRLHTHDKVQHNHLDLWGTSPRSLSLLRSASYSIVA